MDTQLIVNWEKIHLYNSLMSVVAGVAFMSLWRLFTNLYSEREIRPVGTALNFAVVGFILMVTGIHTTLTWPLAPTYPFDNAIFGETCFVFGGMILALAYYFWKGRDVITRLSIENRPELMTTLVKDFSMFKYLIIGMGLSAIMMGIAGIQYKIFLAPPEEPLMGPLLDIIPNFTSYVMGGIYILVGVCAVGVYFFINSVMDNKPGKFKWVFTTMFILGFTFMSIGITTYYSHVGMIINTMPADTIKPNVINNPDPRFYDQKMEEYHKEMNHEE